MNDDIFNLKLIKKRKHPFIINISSKIIKKATSRNKIKRRIRSILREILKKKEFKDVNNIILINKFNKNVENIEFRELQELIKIKIQKIQNSS